MRTGHRLYRGEECFTAWSGAIPVRAISRRMILRPAVASLEMTSTLKDFTSEPLSSHLPGTNL
jgi:hypothetical protein